MKSRISLCNGTLLRKNLRRFSPLWTMFFVGLLLTGPVLILHNSGLFFHSVYAPSANYYGARYFETMGDAGSVFLMFYALLCATVCLRYLHKTRSAYMLHALPLTRACHFCTNLLSGLLFGLVPMAAIGCLDGLTLLLRGIPLGAVHWLRMLAKWCLQFLFYYGAAVFCMVLSGQTAIAVLSYFALNLIGWFLPTIVQQTLVEPLVIGYVYRDFTFLSPLLRLTEEGTKLADAYIYICAGVGILFMAVAWLHYRLRHMERAGDAMAYGWAKPVYAVLFALCFGLFFGMILGLIFSSELTDYIVWICLGTVLGWIGAQMMLKRTVRIWKQKHWLGLLALVAAILALVIGMRYDVLGWQKHVPEASSIERVELSTSSDEWSNNSDLLVITDPADLELVCTIHREICDGTGPQLGKYGSRIIYSDFDFSRSHLNLTYHLKNGTTLQRSYDVNISRDFQNVGQIMKQLYSKPEYVEQCYARLLETPFETAQLERTDSWDDAPSYCHDADALRAAIMEDVRAGRLPIQNDITWGGSTWKLILIRKDETRVYVDIPLRATSTLAVFGK